MKSYKARGIVLHTLKYGESSSVVYLLTDTCGRQTYMVQGVRNSKGRTGKSALLQPMMPVEFIGLESPKMEMHRMKDLKTGMLLTSTPFDVRKSTIALFMAETLYRLVREIEPESSLFRYVWSSVEVLDSLNEGVANFHLWFLVRLSAYMGYYPGNEYIPGCWFDIQEGVFTPLRPVHSLFLDRDATALLNTLMEAEPGRLADIRLDRQTRSAFLESLLNYISYHLDTIRQVRSVSILREVF